MHVIIAMCSAKYVSLVDGACKKNHGYYVQLWQKVVHNFCKDAQRAYACLYMLRYVQ
jgi:hypothetical protein